MRYCWRLGRASTRQILAEAEKDGPRDYRTLQEFLRRISVKGWLAVTKERNVNYYEPLLDKETGTRFVIERFLGETLADEPESLRLLDQALAAHRERYLIN